MLQQQRLDEESVAAQFNRLVRDLINGTLNRSSFRPWEINLLLDISRCKVPRKRRLEILRKYQRAVRCQLQNGATTPPKLSEYLAMNATGLGLGQKKERSADGQED